MTTLQLDNERIRIKEICERRDIQWLCHFTPRTNLPLILEKGLVPRNSLPKNAKTTDNIRADGSNAICLSINNFNRRMANRKISEGYDLCLLVIDPSVLYLKICLFYPHNAATKCYRGLPKGGFLGSKALEAVFANTITFQKSGLGSKSEKRKKMLPNNQPTSIQAEVQCYEEIEAQFITHVIYNGKIFSL